MSPGLALEEATSASQTELEVAYCMASLDSGLLLADGVDVRARACLEGLAATLPELFGVVDPACLDRIAERSGGVGGGQNFGEMLLLSAEHVHLIRPLRNRPGVALLATSPLTGSIGLLLSEFHARVAALEGP